jgi:hypothetical protein
MEMLLRPLLFLHHYLVHDGSAANPSSNVPKSSIKFFVLDSTTIFSIILTFLWSCRIGFFIPFLLID